jgi:hypothetical protein
MKKLSLSFLGLFVFSSAVQARDWTEADLVQDVTLSCQLLSVVGTSTQRFAGVELVSRTPGLRGSPSVTGVFEGLAYRGELRVVDTGAYLALKDGDDRVLSELVWSEYLSGDDIWVTHSLAENKSVKWLCSYRSSKGKDLMRLRELHTTLGMLVDGLNDVTGKRGTPKAPPISVPEACYRVGIALMRAQKLAERSTTNSVGWRARTTITDLRDRVAIEGVNLCRTSATMADVQEALNRMALAIAKVRDAVSPDTYAAFARDE